MSNAGIGIGVVVAGLIAMALIAMLFGPVYTVGANQRALVTDWGDPGIDVINYIEAVGTGDTKTMNELRPKIAAKSIGPGIHWKTPIAQGYHTMDVNTQVYMATCEAASADLQDVKTVVAVNYHLDPTMVPVIYTRLGEAYQDTIIGIKTQEVVKATTAKFVADQLVNNRSVVQSRIEGALRDILKPYDIVIEGIAITDFQFSQSFQDAIEAKSTMMQQKLTAQQEYEKNVINQKSKLVELETEAKGMQAQREMVTPELIELRKIDMMNNWIKKWQGQMPQTMLGNGGVIPTFAVNGQ